MDNMTPAIIQKLDGKLCDGSGNEIVNDVVLDSLPPYVFRGADLVKLDADLKLIGEGKLNVALPEDNYDYDNHQWETSKGKLIGEVLAQENLCDFHQVNCCMECWSSKETVL